MRNKKIIAFLEQAEKDFRKKPSTLIKNSYGLCYYISDSDLSKYITAKKILGDKYKDVYSFCYRMPQYEIYTKKLSHLYNERADWCRERIKYFKSL